MRSYLALLSVLLMFTGFCIAEEQKDSDEVHEVDPSTLPAANDEDLDALFASHVEIEPIGDSDEISFDNLTTFAMDRNGNILACDAGNQQVCVLDPAGKKIATVDVGFKPYSICACPDGTVYLAGNGIVVKYNDKGELLKKITADDDDIPDAKSSGMTVMGSELFVAFGRGGSVRSRSQIIRFDMDMNDPKMIIDDLRGCCQRLDLASRDGVLYVAENARYRVLQLDREGEILNKWGKQDRRNIDGFASCCNPMNLFFNAEGDLYTAESGVGRIKVYSPDGKYKSLIGHVGTARFSKRSTMASSCSNIAIAASKDESYVYVLDFRNNLIRILERDESLVINE